VPAIARGSIFPVTTVDGSAGKEGGSAVAGSPWRAIGGISKARRGMCDSRGAGVLATAFVAGVLCTAALTADGLRDPIPSPFFGLEEPPIPDSVAPAVERQVDEPQAIAVAAPRPPVGGFADMAAALARPPERLAVAPGHGPIAAAIQSQALPTAARGGSDPVAHAAPLVQSQPPLDSRAVAEPELHVLTEEQAPRPAADELKALVERVRPAPAEPPPRIAEPPGLRPAPPPKPAPLPGEEWIDPEQVNWSDAAADRGQPPASAARPFAGGRRRGIFGDRRPEGAGGVAEPAASPRPVKLLERLRGDRRSAPESGPFPGGAVADDPPPEVGRWPTPTRLLGQLEQVGNNVRLGQAGHAEIAAWTALCGERIGVPPLRSSPSATSSPPACQPEMPWRMPGWRRSRGGRRWPFPAASPCGGRRRPCAKRSPGVPARRQPWTSIAGWPPRDWRPRSPCC
jgi:hypothetical protein